MKNWDLSLDEVIGLKETAALYRQRSAEASARDEEGIASDLASDALPFDAEALSICKAIASDLHGEMGTTEEDAALMIFNNPEQYMQKRR